MLSDITVIPNVLAELMKYIRFVLVAIPILLLASMVAFAMWNLSCRHHDVSIERYNSEITVDDSSKIPKAISNVVENVCSKGFIMTSLSVQRDELKKTFTVRCKGSELADILNLD